MKLLVNNKYRLEKFNGKGGWTFARIPGIPQDKKISWGRVKLAGSIDGYEIKKTHLMPMGEGLVFLPVRAEIRKHIKKQAGDWVHIILYPDTQPLEVPEEFLTCLKDEPAALAFFNSLSESERKFYIDWVYSAKKEETKISRLSKTITRLLKKLKRYQKENE